MKFSKSRTKIVAALAAIQATARAPKKSREVEVSTKSGGKYAYKYADLDEVMDCVRTPIKDAECVLVQGTGMANGQYSLITKLIHVESCESVSIATPLDVEQNPQDQGAEITYFRRYQVQSLFGLVAEDDQDLSGVQRRMSVKTVNSFIPNGNGNGQKGFF